MSSVNIAASSKCQESCQTHFNKIEHINILSTFFLGVISHGAQILCSTVDWVLLGQLHSPQTGPSRLSPFCALRYLVSLISNFILYPLSSYLPLCTEWEAKGNESIDILCVWNVISPLDLIYSLVENVITVRIHFPQDCDAFISLLSSNCQCGN